MVVLCSGLVAGYLYEEARVRFGATMHEMCRV